MTLNWKSDPLFYDAAPKSPNLWETANSLIRQDRGNNIFQNQFPKISLYPIIIRKIDFNSSERLLQSLPYIVLTSYWKNKIRKQSLNLAERCHNYFRNSTIENSIREWQKKIINYCDIQNRIPLPLFRLTDDWEKFFCSKSVVPFQSARGESFHLPIILTPDFTYLLGVIVGDGHLNYHNIVLVDFSKEHVEMIQALAKALFGIEGTISGEEKRWLLHLNNKWLVRLANFFTDQPIEGKKYDSLQEPLILHFDDLLRRHFWSGVLDADGSYKKEISLCSKSKFFVQAFGSFLLDYNISFKIRKLRNSLADGYTLKTSVQFKKEIGSLLFPRHVKKIQDFQDYITSKTYRPRKKHNDNLAELQNKNQDLYFKSFNQDKIISEGSRSFFDFSLPHLGVLHCQEFLKALRIHLSWTQQQLADYLFLPKNVVNSYEHTSDITLQLLEKLLPLFPDKQPKSLILFLQQNDLVVFRSRKTIATLPLQPSDELLSLLQQLELRRGYLLINPKNGHKDQVRGKLSNYFSIPKPVGYKLSNSVVYQFARTFCQIGASTED